MQCLRLYLIVSLDGYAPLHHAMAEPIIVIPLIPFLMLLGMALPSSRRLETAMVKIRLTWKTCNAQSCQVDKLVELLYVEFY